MAPVPLDVLATLPHDGTAGALAGRVWNPEHGGPAVVALRDGMVIDISRSFPTMRDLCEDQAPAEALRAAEGERIGSLEDILAQHAGRRPAMSACPGCWRRSTCRPSRRRASPSRFPCSSGSSRSEPAATSTRPPSIRSEIIGMVGEDFSKLKPGSPEAMRLKAVLIEQGAWSQYLEVGIGPDAEIFTKSPSMSAVGTGSDAGIHPKSTWNNPEPEVVLAVASDGADRRRDARQRREPARLRGPLGPAAQQGQGQQRQLRARAVPALLRCRFHARSCARHGAQADRRRPGGLPARRRELDVEDQPRSGRSGRRDDQPQPPISGRGRALPRNAVRPGRGSRRARAWASRTRSATSSRSRRPSSAP